MCGGWSCSGWLHRSFHCHKLLLLLLPLLFMAPPSFYGDKDCSSFLEFFPGASSMFFKSSRYTGVHSTCSPYPRPAPNTSKLVS